MARFYSKVVISVVIASSLVVDAYSQQQVTVGTPFHSSSGGYFEYFGVGFGFQHASPGGWLFFNSGNAMSATPPFGGFDPSSVSTFGVGGRNGNSGWNLNLSAAQGYSQSSASTTPSLTLPNGGFGFINSTVQRPFVVGFVPVVSEESQADRLKRMRQYDQAAQNVISEGLRRDKRDEAEFKELQAEAKRSLAKSRPKEEDPPLILGRPSFEY